MYAVIESGGKQYRVAVGDRVRVESLKAEPGATISLEKILLVADGSSVQVGAAALDTKIEAMVIGHGRGDKVRVFKMKRRKNSRQRAGHRQNYTELEITGIGGATAKSSPKQAEQQPAAEASKGAAKASESEVTAQAEADDLTQINGIGPVIVEKLNAIGITTFEQIASFTAEDVERVNEQLNFKGRIERDDWVDQAKTLLAGGSE